MTDKNQLRVIHLEDESSIAASVKNALPWNVPYMSIPHLSWFHDILQADQGNSSIFILDDKVPLSSATGNNKSAEGIILTEAIHKITGGIEQRAQNIVIYAIWSAEENDIDPCTYNYYQKSDFDRMMTCVKKRIEAIREAQD